MLGDQTHNLMTVWSQGPLHGGVRIPGAYVGDDARPHSRVTLEPGYWLRLTEGGVGNFASNKLPIRWWRNVNNTLPNMSQEVEVPNIKSIETTRSLDQDASSCTIIMYDQIMSPLSSAGQIDVGPNGGSPGPQWLGQPGAYSPTYMGSASAQTRWGGQPTYWSQVLTPNALLRSYQGYGGYTNGIPNAINAAVASQNLVLTGTWLIDEVDVSTDGMITLKCRDMAKLLVDQMVYPPFIPVGLYPLHYCFPPDTLVNMADGSYKPIEQVVVGDEVLTHDGVGKVKRTFEYDYAGELVRVRRSGSSVTVAATPTHGFLATPHKADRNICGGYRFRKIDDSSTWKFVDAEDLEEGYWLSAAYPTEEVDFLVDLLSLDEHLQSYFDRGGVERAGIVSTIWKRFLDRDMPRYVEMSEDLAWVLGLWMAEGCFGNKSKYGYPLEIIWNLGSHEQTLADELVERCVRLGVGEPKIQVPSHRPGRFRITLTNAPLAIMLRHLCGEYAPLKQASREIMLMPRRFQSCFLSGYRAGDGHVYRQAKRYCKSEQLLDRPVTHDASITASPVLARQLGLLGARVEKCIPRIYEDDHSVVYEGGFSTENSAWHVDSAQRTMRGRRRQRDGYYAAKITGLTREEYQGKIHSFEVDSQHTYVVEDMVVSNSAYFYPSFNNPIPYGPAIANTRWITKAAITPASDGYWLLGSDGGVFSFGNAGFYGSLGGQLNGTYSFAIAAPESVITCDIMRSPTGAGYTVVTNSGVIYGYGDGNSFGGGIKTTLNYPMTAAASTPNGTGCWLLSVEGGVFAMGSATYYGGGPQKGAIQYVDIEPTPTGHGYWLLASDGDVYSFGDASYHGGAAADLGGSPATAMSATPSGNGYVIVNALGAVFNFGDSQYYGSIISDEQAGDFTQLDALITDVVTDEAGYRLIGLDGGVFCQPPGTKVRVATGPDYVQGKSQCGTYTGYCRGCRCKDCQIARQSYEKDHPRPRSERGKGRKPSVGPRSSCQEIPLEDVKVGDRVVSFNLTKQSVRRSGSRVTKVVRRQYDGPMVRLTTLNNWSSAYTPEHPCVIAPGGPAIRDKSVVYLMRRNKSYRVGRCPWLYGEEGTIGPVRRGRSEKPDALWVLSIHDSSEEAALVEALTQTEYGLPGQRFRPDNRTSWHHMDLEQFWLKIGDNSKRAERCLREHGRDISFPLWTRDQPPIHSSRPQIIAACNVLTGMSVLPVDNCVQADKDGMFVATNGRKNEFALDNWESAVVTREWYVGDVISLTVERDHTYVGDGIVTHNCFGDSQFYGSLAGPFDLQIPGNMGNPPDYANVVSDILLWAGFYAYPSLNTDGSPAVYGVIEKTGAYPVNSILGGLDPAGQIADDIFNKLPPMNSITTIKEILGFIFKLNEDGSAFFGAPNIYSPGNFLPTGAQTTFIPVVDEALQLTEYTLAINDQDIRSEIIIGSFEPLAKAPGSVSVSYTPKHNLNYLRGMVKPAEWIDQFFIDEAQQQLMAELLALMIWQKLRQGSVSCAALPLLQLDDQIRIMERQSGETYIHHVQSIHSTHDLDQGTYTMSISTNWLGDETTWSINAPREFTLWSKTVVGSTTGGTIAVPAAPSVIVTGAPGQTKVWYAITALTANGETTVGASTEITTSANPLSPTHYNAVSWGAIDGATSYNVYKSGDGHTFFLLAGATNTSYNDAGATISNILPPVLNTATVLTAPTPATVTCYTNNLFTGSPTISGTGFSISAGSVLVVDSALNREVVVVTSVNGGAGTFTANFSQPHQNVYTVVGVMNDTNPADFLP